MPLRATLQVEGPLCSCHDSTTASEVVQASPQIVSEAATSPVCAGHRLGSACQALDAIQVRMNFAVSPKARRGLSGCSACPSAAHFDAWRPLLPGGGAARVVAVVPARRRCRNPGGGDAVERGVVFLSALRGWSGRHGVRRDVAQLGSALDWGSRGRRFKSCHPDRRSRGAPREDCRRGAVLG